MPHQVGGALCLFVSGEGRRALAYTAARFSNAAHDCLRVRWTQWGHRTAPVPGFPGRYVVRNPFGALDGIVNPVGIENMTKVVTAWSPAVPAWLAGGCYMGVRKIAMDVRSWSFLDPSTQGDIIGRDMKSGQLHPANAGDREGSPSASHVTIVRRGLQGSQMLRRGFSYSGTEGTGLLFTAFFADPLRQFLGPLLSLSQFDPMSDFVRHVGSGIFAVPPLHLGPGRFLADELLAS